MHKSSKTAKLAHASAETANENGNGRQTETTDLAPRFVLIKFHAMGVGSKCMSYCYEAKKKGYNFHEETSSQISMELGQKCMKQFQPFHFGLPNRLCLKDHNS